MTAPFNKSADVDHQLYDNKEVIIYYFKYEKYVYCAVKTHCQMKKNQK